MHVNVRDCWRATSLIVSLLCLLAPRIFAQSATSTLFGTVFDQQGEVVVGANVSAANLANGQIRATVSDANGRYIFLSLPPESYDLRVDMSGFATNTRTIGVTAGQALKIDIFLRPRGIDEQVAVTSRASSLDTRTAVGRAILQEELRSLPIADRDFASLGVLTPGVLANQSPNLHNTSAIVSGGQSGRSNTFLLDGASLDDTFQANPRGGIPLEAVREFVVLTDGYPAQYGQASGAIVSVVSRSGSNGYEGGGGYLLRDRQFSAVNPMARLSARPDASGDSRLQQNIATVSVGGPIRRNRTFFFAAIEGTRTSTAAVTTSPLLSVFRPGVSPVSTIRSWHWQLFGRADSTLGKGQLTANFRIDRTAGPSTAGGPLSPESTNDGVLDDRELALTYRAAWTDAENELGVSVSRRYWSFDRGTYCADLCPSVSEVRPSITLGASSTDGIRTTEMYSQVREIVSTHRSGRAGDHSVSAGTTAMLVDGRFLGSSNRSGTFTFSTDVPFDASRDATYPATYTQTLGNPDVRLQHVLTAAFVQERWSPRPRAAIDAGIRWDYDSLTGVSHDWNNLAPRIGVAFTPSRSGRALLRGSYGRFFDQTFEVYVRQYRQSVQTTQLFVSNPGYPNWQDPSAVPGRVSQGQPNARQLSEIQTPSADRATLGLLRTDTGFNLSVDAVWGRAHDLLETFDANPPDENGRRPDPAHTVVRVVRSDGRSSYRGLQLGMTTRLPHGSWLSTAYTLSSAVGNTDGLEFTPQDQRNPDGDWGPLISNLRHQLVASGGAHLPLRVVLGWLMTIRSGAPYTILTGKDTNGDGFRNDRPADVSRNSARGTGLFQLDVRCAKPFRIDRVDFDVSAEAFNLTNHANWSAFDGNLLSTTYGLPTAAGMARQIQIGAHLRF